MLLKDISVSDCIQRIKKESPSATKLQLFNIQGNASQLKKLQNAIVSHFTSLTEFVWQFTGGPAINLTPILKKFSLRVFVCNGHNKTLFQSEANQLREMNIEILCLFSKTKPSFSVFQALLDHDNWNLTQLNLDIFGNEEFFDWDESLDLNEEDSAIIDLFGKLGLNSSGLQKLEWHRSGRIESCCWASLLKNVRALKKVEFSHCSYDVDTICELISLQTNLRRFGIFDTHHGCLMAETIEPILARCANLRRLELLNMRKEEDGVFLRVAHYCRNLEVFIYTGEGSMSVSSCYLMPLLDRNAVPKLKMLVLGNEDCSQFMKQELEENKGFEVRCRYSNASFGAVCSCQDWGMEDSCPEFKLMKKSKKRKAKQQKPQLKRRKKK